MVSSPNAASTILSSPGPPCSWSSPSPPSMASAPVPPEIVSLPRSPLRRSAPPIPRRVSLPPPPFMVSAPLPPVRWSGPAPPSRARAGTTATARLAASRIDRTLDRRIVGSSAIAPGGRNRDLPERSGRRARAAAADEHRRAGEDDADHRAGRHHLPASRGDEIEPQAADGLTGRHREDQAQDAQARDDHGHRRRDRGA